MLYWRSEILLQDPTILLNNENWPKEASLFFDVTFEFIHGKNISVTLAALFLNEDDSCIYAKTSPLSLQVLEDHAKTASVDLMSGPPKAMAGMMGTAMKQFQQGNNQSSIKLENNKLVLSLYYPKLSESGILHLDIQKTTSKFDSLGMTPLYWAITTEARKSIEDKISQEYELDTAFGEWLKYQAPTTSTIIEETKDTNTIKKETPSSTNATTTTTNKGRPPQQIHHFRDVRRKKRKKGPMYKQAQS